MKEKEKISKLETSSCQHLHNILCRISGMKNIVIILLFSVAIINGCNAGIQEQKSKVINLGANKKIELKEKVICIYAGHQRYADSSKENIAPNSKILKEKCTAGTSGIVTHVAEHELNLKVSLMLKNELKRYGARVIMTRTSSNVSVSNIERALIANKYKSDLCVRIHADGSIKRSVKGISVLYPGNMYIKDKTILKNSKMAALAILVGLKKYTGITGRLVERNDLTGFNWSRVPVVLVEMGFMSNPSEDRLLQTADYRAKIVKGIVEGIYSYIN